MPEMCLKCWIVKMPKCCNYETMQHWNVKIMTKCLGKKMVWNCLKNLEMAGNVCK